MTTEPPSMTSDHVEIEARIVGLYNVLYDDELTVDDIEFYDLEEDYYEGEIYMPYIGINVGLWEAEWSTEKRIEVLIHEFAHTEKMDDDHHPDFWDRVVRLTETVIEHRDTVAGIFDDEVDPDALKQTVVESVHEYVIEEDIDTVPRRQREVAEALDLAHDPAEAAEW